MPKPSPDLSATPMGLAGQRIPRLAAVGVDVDAREALAQRIVGDDVARGVERGARRVDRGGPFGSQPVPWSRMYCTRTGLPTALASTAASIAQSSASLRP